MLLSGRLESCFFSLLEVHLLACSIQNLQETQQQRTVPADRAQYGQGVGSFFALRHWMPPRRAFDGQFAVNGLS